MPETKLNHRQERFVQLVKQGLSQRQAYPLAGYAAHAANPSRLSAHEGVKRRLDEISRQMAEKTRVTIASITEELEEERMAAHNAGQTGVAVQAIVYKAKLHGLLVARSETGAPGDFAALQTPEQVLAVIRRDLGDDVAAALAAMLAKPVTPESPLPALAPPDDDASD